MRKVIRNSIIIILINVIIFSNCFVYADQNVSDTSSSVSLEKYIDIFSLLRISGDSESGYYYEFKNNAINELNQIYAQNANLLRSANITSVEDLKEFVKAQAASELPSLGGIVSAKYTISDGTEATDTTKSALKVTSQIPEGTTSSSSNSNGTFTWPVAKNDTPEKRGEAIVSVYGYRGFPLDFSLGNNGYHKAMDIGGDRGDDIVAIADGEVLYAGYESPHWSYGYGVVIDHGEINGKHLISSYAHLNDTTVNPGDTVKQGDLIAHMGNTGAAKDTIVHLCFGIWVDALWSGEDIDPLSLYTSDYIAGEQLGWNGKRSETKFADSMTYSSNTVINSAKSNFTSTKDTTKAAQSLLNNEITVSQNEQRFYGDRLNGGVILRRIVPNKEFGDTNLPISKNTIVYQEYNESRGTAQKVPYKLAQKLNIDNNDFSLLYIPYLDFNEDIQTGKMIVKTEYANEVLDYFYYLFSEKYKIEKMYLPQEYKMDLNDITIPYNSYEKQKIYELAYLNGTTIPDEGSQDYVETVNKLYEETLIYYIPYFKSLTSKYTGEIYNEDGTEFATKYKIYLQKIKDQYNEYKEEIKGTDQEKTNKIAFDKKKNANDLIDRTKNKGSSIEEKNALDNNTYGYLAGNNETSGGYSFTINPYYNPQLQDGNLVFDNIDEKYENILPLNSVFTADEISYRFVGASDIVNAAQDLKWEWQGIVIEPDAKDQKTTGNLGRFIRNIESKDEADKEEKIIDSYVYDLSYISLREFNSYIQEGDPRILYHFTIGDDGYIYTATWEYRDDGCGNKSVKYVVSNPITFYQSLYKYEMSVEYLICTAIASQDRDFVLDLAKLGQKSTYIMAIEDEVSVTTKQSSESNAISVEETVSEIQEILYVNNWYTKYVKFFAESETSDLYSPLFLTEPINMQFIASQRKSFSVSQTQKNQVEYTNDIVEQAKEIHKVLEDEGYTYGANPAQTLEESKIKQVDCSTYVRWVLKRFGIDLPEVTCKDMKAPLDSASWCKRVNVEDIEAGDIVLYPGHIAIFGGYNESGQTTWYDTGATNSIQTPAPGVCPPVGLGLDNESYPVVGIYRVTSIGENKSSSNNTSIDTANTSIDTAKLQFVGDSWIEIFEQYNEIHPNKYKYGKGSKHASSDEMQPGTVLEKIESDASAIIVNLGLNAPSITNAKAEIELLKELRDKTGKTIFQLKTPHVGRKYYYYPIDEQNANIDIYNEYIEKEIANLDGIYLIDVTNELQDEEGYLKPEYETSDGLHLNSQTAYRNWYNAILEKIKNGQYGSLVSYTKNEVKFSYTNARTYTTGNSNDFVRIYNKASSNVKSSLSSNWVEESLSLKSNTYQLKNVTKYLLYKANEQNYKSTTLRWSEFAPDELRPKNQTKEGFDTDVDEKLLFFCGVLSEGACEGSYDHGDTYGIEVLNDGAGNTTAFGLTHHVIDEWVQENYPNFRNNLLSGEVPKEEAQQVYVHTMQAIKDNLVGEDGTGGTIKDPSNMSQNMLNALIDMQHNTRANGGVKGVIEIYNQKGSVTTQEFEDNWGSNHNYEQALRIRSHNRGVLANEDRWVCYTMRNSENYYGREIEFTSETPWTDFCLGTASIELYEILD